MQDRFEEAVRQYWQVRESQSEKQAASGTSDAGSRGQVTGGGHLNALVALVAEAFIDAGFREDDIKAGSVVELPGYFRPEKKWDLLVIEDEALIAAIEFKSHAGPSFGNNANNRIEEAIGSATDIWTAYREGLLGPVCPWLGYLLLLEECPKSVKPIKPKEPYFPIDEAYRAASYKRRYEVAINRFVRERLYNAACFVTVPRNAADGTVNEPVPELTFKNFIAAVNGRARQVRESSPRK
jgi:hypothetical protein